MIATTIERQAAVIVRWKADNGITGRDYVPVNSGARRSDTKRQLLQTIADSAKREDKEPPFKARH